MSRFVNLKDSRFYTFLVSALLFATLISSCQSTKNVVYVQNSGAKIDLSKSSLPTLPEILVKNGDVLSISVSTFSADVSAPFNTTLIGQSSNSTIQGYLVDNKGEINFPVLGKIAVSGLSKRQIEENVKALIFPRYIKENPIITVRIVNFKVTLLGDISGSKVIPVPDERITILEALAQGGDLQITGRRDNVLLIRESKTGERETFRIDLRDKNLIESPYYYLQQNDLVYIEPNSVKKSSASGMGVQQVFMFVTPLISLISLIVTLSR
jgi:polysaccharide export outer membrane protein